MSKWEELEKAARAATPGPWITMEVGDFEEQFAVADTEGVSILTVVEEGKATFGAIYSDDDAAYIAAANPSAILELLAERDALKEQMREVAMLLLDNDRSGIKQWADGLILGESSGEWSVRTVVTDQQKEIDALKAENERLTNCLKKANDQTEDFERRWYLADMELDRIRAMEPVAWMVRNGWVEYQLVGNKKHADAIAAEMQKRHDLSGSLADFRVFPLYYAEESTSHVTADELESALEALVDRCNNSTDSCNWDEVIAAEAVLERIYKSRSKEKP